MVESAVHPQDDCENGRMCCAPCSLVPRCSVFSRAIHAQTICTKARRVIGVLYRHFYLNADTNSLLQLYLSMVRPLLEYACQVWHPHLTKDIKKLESVQKLALRLCSISNGIWTTTCYFLFAIFQP